MTSEKRSKHALCDAKKANGQRCRAFAGQGTSHPGRGHCKHHGGSLPVQEAAVARREVLEMVRAEGPMEDVTPEQAVMWMLRLTAGRANSLERASREEEGVRADVLAVIRDQVFDRLLKISAVAMQYGLTDHEIRVEQQQATFVLWAIDSALGDAGLGNRERNIIGAFIRKLMAEQAEDVDALAAATARLEDLRNEGVADAEVVEEPGD